MPSLVSLCPLCGSERVIPLTFPPGLGSVVRDDKDELPIAKCTVCSHRFYDGEIELLDEDSSN